MSTVNAGHFGAGRVSQRCGSYSRTNRRSAHDGGQFARSSIACKLVCQWARGRTFNDSQWRIGTLLRNCTITCRDPPRSSKKLLVCDSRSNRAMWEQFPQADERVVMLRREEWQLERAAERGHPGKSGNGQCRQPGALPPGAFGRAKWQSWRIRDRLILRQTRITPPKRHMARRLNRSIMADSVPCTPPPNSSAARGESGASSARGSSTGSGNC